MKKSSEGYAYALCSTLIAGFDIFIGFYIHDRWPTISLCKFLLAAAWAVVAVLCVLQAGKYRDIGL